MNARIIKFISCEYVRELNYANDLHFSPLKQIYII